MAIPRTTDVGEPQCNGVAERFMRTLKEQCVYLHHFESLEQARAIIAEFIDRSLTTLSDEELDALIERARARADLPETAAAAVIGEAVRAVRAQSRS